MSIWKIVEEEYDINRISNTGNKFLVGNGYLGIRGTLQEYEKEHFPAINLAGIYDRVGDGWREPLNAPNGLFTYFELNGREYRLPEIPSDRHKISLDFRHGILSRKTKWDTPEGTVTLKAERFASFDRQHLIAMKYVITADYDGEIKLHTGIDGMVWDINGPHYDEILLDNQGDMLRTIGITHENRDQVCVCEVIHTDFRYEEQIRKENRRIMRYLTFPAKAGRVYTLYKWVSVYTSKDSPDYAKKAAFLVHEGKEEGYQKTLFKSSYEWDKKWKICEVTIDGDDEAMQALNYSNYHLLCIAPRRLHDSGRRLRRYSSGEWKSESKTRLTGGLEQHVI